MKVVIRKFGEAEVNHEIGVFASLVESPLARSTIQQILQTLRFMILVKASADSEAGTLPSEALMAAVGNYKISTHR